MVEKGLGRKIRYDARSKSFRVGDTIEENNLRSYTWRCNEVLNQGNDSSCVGCAWTHLIGSRPKESPISYPQAVLYYQMAQLHDPWQGGSYIEDKLSPYYYEGSSVLGGAQALYKANLISEYLWCFSLEDILMALSWKGPVVMGTLWYEQMFYPDNKGYIKPEGSMAGGHAYLVNSISLKEQCVTITNSWGREWGKDGTAKISFDDLQLLLFQDGEACCATEYYLK